MGQNQTTKETTNSAPSSAPVPGTTPVPDRTKPRIPRLFILILILLLGAWLGTGYWYYTNQYLSTDDAFVSGNQVLIGAEISGQVLSAPLRNNENVEKGALLFTLDPTPFRAAVKAARAGMATAEREQRAAEAAVVTAQAALQQQQAHAQSLHDHLQRLLGMRNQKFVSAQDLEDAQSAYAVAQATVKQARAALAQAQATAGKPGVENDRIQAAEAKLTQAEYALSQTQVRAPMSGILANYGLMTGQPVIANQPLFSIVATRGLWVNANFKETDLGAIHAGERVEITSDIYPKRVIKGHVLSIAAGAGNAFSLLPPQNATGNWVKVTQRVPVRIQLDATTDTLRLPIGTSTTARILRTPKPLAFWQSLLAVLGIRASDRPDASD